jgi:hypothetical protein
MKVKTKKLHSRGIFRLETGGEIKEVAINEDLLHPDKETVQIFFRGKISSGILELSAEEIDMIAKKIQPKTKLAKDVKILRFEK